MDKLTTGLIYVNKLAILGNKITEKRHHNFLNWILVQHTYSRVNRKTGTDRLLYNWECYSTNWYV